MVFRSKGVGDTEECAATFVEFISKKEQNNEATVVALHGDLGSGKTTFVKAAAKMFGILETVTSPTFVIEKIYKLENKKFKHLIHVDAYRLTDEDELLNLGWNDISSDANNIIFVEWAENVEKLLPDSALHITFSHNTEEGRDIEIHHAKE